MDAMRRPKFWGGLTCIIAVGISVWAWLRQGPAVRVGVLNAPQRLEVYGEVPSFSLIAQTGQVVTHKAFEGKVWIANFIFTSCRATCPQQTATMAQLQRDLAAELDIRLVSVTVDPEHDTPEVLARYAERFHANPLRWLFLTGEERDVYSLAQDGFHLSATVVPAVAPTPVSQAFSGGPGVPAGPSEGDRAPFTADSPDTDALVHDARFALVDRMARIRGYYSSLDPEAVARLRDDVNTLLKEGK
jgi:protein SCO1/2